MASLADWIRSHVEDYGQLKEGYPNAVKFGSALKKGISDLVPTTEELQNPAMMSERAMNYVNPMAGVTKIANNLNAGLLSKHLSGKGLTPEEMLTYEANGRLMETPQLQRYNVANAEAQIPNSTTRETLWGTTYGAEGPDFYHGTLANNIKEFNHNAKRPDGKRSGGAGTASFTRDPAFASSYAQSPIISGQSGINYLNLSPKKQEKLIKEGSNVMPIRLNTKDAFDYMNPEHNAKAMDYLRNKYTESRNTGDGLNYNPLRDFEDYGSQLHQGDWEIMEKRLGPDFYKDNNFSGAHELEYGAKNFITHEPKNIRSRFAAFDPLRKNSSSLLASIIGGTALASQYDKEKKLKEMR